MKIILVQALIKQSAEDERFSIIKVGSYVCDGKPVNLDIL